MKITYAEWVANLNTDGWTYIGEWAFPRKENSTYSQVFYHWCGSNPDRRGDGFIYSDLQENECNRCGAVVPEGIKMVMMLTEVL